MRHSHYVSPLKKYQGWALEFPCALLPVIHVSAEECIGCFDNTFGSEAELYRCGTHARILYDGEQVWLNI